jgi:hypothetical protein
MASGLDVGVLKGFLSDLYHQPLLRIHQFCLLNLPKRETVTEKIDPTLVFRDGVNKNSFEKKLIGAPELQMLQDQKDPHASGIHQLGLQPCLSRVIHLRSTCPVARRIRQILL